MCCDPLFKTETGKEGFHWLWLPPVHVKHCCGKRSLSSEGRFPDTDSELCWKGSDIPPQNLQPWHINYFELKAAEKIAGAGRALHPSPLLPKRENKACISGTKKRTLLSPATENWFQGESVFKKTFWNNPYLPSISPPTFPSHAATVHWPAPQLSLSLSAHVSAAHCSRFHGDAATRPNRFSTVPTSSYEAPMPYKNINVK